MIAAILLINFLSLRSRDFHTQQGERKFNKILSVDFIAFGEKLNLIHFSTDNIKPHHCDETSTISMQQPVPGSDISYSIRHVEESWHHLIKSDDSKKLKEIAVCNFDFLLAAVSLSLLSDCIADLIC